MKLASPASAFGSSTTGTRMNVPATPVRSKLPMVSDPSPLRLKKRSPVSLSPTSALSTSLETARRVSDTLRASASSDASMMSDTQSSMVMFASCGASILLASLDASR